MLGPQRAIPLKKPHTEETYPHPKGVQGTRPWCHVEPGGQGTRALAPGCPGESLCLVGWGGVSRKPYSPRLGRALGAARLPPGSQGFLLMVPPGSKQFSAQGVQERNHPELLFRAPKSSSAVVLYVSAQKRIQGEVV